MANTSLASLPRNRALEATHTWLGSGNHSPLSQTKPPSCTTPLCQIPTDAGVTGKMPLLVWKIADKHLDEHTLKSLFQQPRIYLTEAVNWGNQKETVRFLQKLRLRSMDTPIIQHVEQCLSQPQLLKQACHLPRINSMALTIAAQFPQFIDTPLHHSLARQPCRPEQCKQLHATLSDTLALAQWLNKPLSIIKKFRFEIEIEEIYKEWLSESLKKQNTSYQTIRKQHLLRKVQIVSLS